MIWIFSSHNFPSSLEDVSSSDPSLPGSRAGFGPSAWGRDSRCVPVCPPGVSVASCCFSSVGALPQSGPLVCLPVRFYDSVGLSLLTVCAFFTSPNISASFYLYAITLSLSSFLHPLWLTSVISPPSPGLFFAVAACRSDRDRWSQMISGLYSLLQETAWYCCWRGALRVSAGSVRWRSSVT